MNKDEMLAQFEKNIEYMQKVIPPDDIYIFAEQTFMAAMFFMQRWSKLVDVYEEAAECPITKKWIVNLMSYIECRENDLDMHLDLGMPEYDE